jgi:hypothetical protein
MHDRRRLVGGACCHYQISSPAPAGPRVVTRRPVHVFGAPSGPAQEEGDACTVPQYVEAEFNLKQYLVDFCHPQVVMTYCILLQVCTVRCMPGLVLGRCDANDQ